MRKYFIPILVAFLLTGAACSKKPGVSTNTGPTPNTNAAGVLTTTSNRSSNANVDTTNATVVRAAIVTITSQGVDPTNFSVPVGTTVSFQNQDSVGHWIASNPHPSHSGLPGFDALATTEPGGAYSYTFTKAGTWGYHDHGDPSNAKFTGSVTVTNP